LLTKKVLVTAAMAFLLLSLIPVTPSSALGEEPVVIASGENTAFNTNLEGDSPLKDYTSSPPVMAAARVGSGAVVATGAAGTSRDESWNDPDNPYPYFDKLLDVTFQWMVSGATNLLWYEGYSVYNDASECEDLIDNLVNMGYNIGTDDRAFENIENLVAYDILIIPQLQLGTPTTGGDPSSLPDVDVQAIVDFVEGGGGLLIMEQADYNGLNFHKVHNKILEALGLDVRFQDDQVQDFTNQWGGEPYRLIVDVDTTTDIGSTYKSRTGVSKIGLDGICSLRIIKNYDVSVRAEPGADAGEAGEILTYEGEILNIGTENDNYTISISDELGWLLSVSENEVSLENGENTKVDVEVTVPEGLTEKVVNWITLKAVGDSGTEDNARFSAVNVFSLAEPPYPIAHPERYDYLGPGAPTLRVELPAVPIITAVETGYGNDLTPREPWPILYAQGEYPPIGAAALVDSGRVIATFNSILRDRYIDSGVLANDESLLLMTRWLIDWDDPREHTFLYYCTEGQLGTYHLPRGTPPDKLGGKPVQVTTWIDMLEEDLGFEVGIQVGDNITPEMLENYDVLQVAELMRSLSPEEIQAITEWVKGGGGLLIMCQADYMGYGRPVYPNEVLEALDTPIWFQDDELYDDINYRVDGPWFPQVYLLDPRAVNPEFDVWFPEHDFTIQMTPHIVTVDDAQVLFALTITNTGSKDTTYGIEVEEITYPENLGWVVEVGPAEVGIAAGENAGVYLVVTVPDIEAGRERMDLYIKVTDDVQTFLTKSEDFAALGEGGRAPPQAKFEVGQKLSHASWGEVTVKKLGYAGGGVWSYAVETEDGELKFAAEEELSTVGISLGIIAAAIVVIVVVVVAVYFILKKR